MEEYADNMGRYKVLAGEIGEYAIVARRKGNEWYVGGITNNKARELTSTFDFR